MQIVSRDLTNQFISNSYQDVVQRYLTGSVDWLLDGLGYTILGIPTSSIGGVVLTQDQTASYASTASYALNAGNVSASYSSFAETASYTITSSYELITEISSSWSSESYHSQIANGTISSSYALFAEMSDTSSTSILSDFSDTASLSLYSNFAGTSSFSITSSWSPNLYPQIEQVSASWTSESFHSTSASYASSATLAFIADVALLADTASLAVSSSYSDFSVSASWAPNLHQQDSSSWSSASLSSSYALTASFALNGGGGGTSLTTGSTYYITSSNAISSSWAPSITNDFSVSSSWASASLSSISASWASTSISSAFASSASYLIGYSVPTLVSSSISSSWASASLFTISSSFASSSISSSYAGNAGTTITTGSTYQITSSYSLNSILANSSTTTSYLSGSNSIVNNLTVTGVLKATQISGSQIYITSSQLTVDSNIITLNAQTPHLRYAGIEMYDSGSSQNLGALLWDGSGNYFFISSSDAGYSRKFITGPDGEFDLTDRYIPLTTGSNGLKDSIIYQSGSSLSINSTKFSSAQESLLVSGSTYNIISGYGNINNYIQLNIKNSNSGTTGSSDVVVTNDTGNEFGNYVDFGINSSGYVSARSVGQANDGYLYNTGSNFYVGNVTTGKNLYLFSGGSVNTSSVTIHSSSCVGFGTINPINKLDVVGNISASFITSSLFGDYINVSNVTASNAMRVGTSTDSSASFYISGSPNINIIEVDKNDGVEVFTLSSVGVTMILSGSITGSVLGSASYATTASYALNAGSGGTSLTTGSTYQITSSWSSNSVTASYFNGQISNATSSSYAQTASWATNATNITNAATASTLSTILTSNATFYVNSGSGNDSNNGLTTGSAFKTIQTAVNYVTSKYFIQNTSSMIIQVAAGTYSESVDLPRITGNGNITINGNTSSTVIVEGSSGNGFQMITGGSGYTLSGIDVRSIGAAGIVSSYNSHIILSSSMKLGACGLYHIYTAYGGVIEVTANYSASASSTVHIISQYGGHIAIGIITASIAAGTYSNVFCLAGFNGNIVSSAKWTSGSVVSSKYLANYNGTINSNGTLNFPGNSAGSTTTGGQIL